MSIVKSQADCSKIIIPKNLGGSAVQYVTPAMVLRILARDLTLKS
jgi:hypothetical protein